MKLRKLKTEDAPLMLEWMHDDFVINDMKTNFATKSLDDCLSFIKVAQNTTKNLHLAIVDDGDTYMGTVSLKNIREGAAEFAITVRKCAMGKGFAKYGMQQIIEKGFTDCGLQNIYWCVAPENKRAVRFYNKNNYKRCKAPAEAQRNYAVEEIEHYVWYEVKHVK